MDGVTRRLFDAGGRDVNSFFPSLSVVYCRCDDGGNDGGNDAITGF